MEGLAKSEIPCRRCRYSSERRGQEWKETWKKSNDTQYDSLQDLLVFSPSCVLFLFSTAFFLDLISPDLLQSPGEVKETDFRLSLLLFNGQLKREERNPLI